MAVDLRDILKQSPVTASAPCRIDMGGTLDISTFYIPLRRYLPCTFNIALDLRTRVTLLPHDTDRIKISSKGFADAQFAPGKAPFDHPLGLMFAVTEYFGVSGVHVKIASSSPPRSALGGSSVAAVALITALSRAFGKADGSKVMARGDAAVLAHAIEQSVAGVPCGFQDMLAAAFGGIHKWEWVAEPGSAGFKRHVVAENNAETYAPYLLVAYCGVPHASKDINSVWVNRFVKGIDRNYWVEIINCTRDFSDAFEKKDMTGAAKAMNRETAIRKQMTPHVLDAMGDQLVDAAVDENCGARFTGAGGGGCLWAVGEKEHIRSLKHVWEGLLSQREHARLLKFKIDGHGVL